MSSEIAVSIRDLSKAYQIYEKPRHRLMQMLFSRMTGRKYYREFWALRDISFEVGKGKVVGILGKNGAGKSTLLQILCGTLSPSTGQVVINGRVAALLELGAGFNPEFTGVENVYMNGQILGLSTQEIDEKLEEIKNFADIGEFIFQPVKTYSSGMFARLAFSVAVHVEPDVLVVDEALSVGDSWFQHKSMAKMRALMSKGCTVLFVSHSIDSVRALCDDAIWIERGCVKMHGDVTVVTNEYMNEVFMERNRILLDVDSSTSHENEGMQEEHLFLEGSDQRITDISATNVKVKLLSAKLYNSNQTETNHIIYKEDFTIEVFLELSRGLSDINVAYVVHDVFGQNLIGGNLLDSGKTLSTLSSSPCRFKISFKSTMNLRGGQSYSVSIRLTQSRRKDRTDMIVIAVHDQELVFDVIGTADEQNWLMFNQDYMATVGEL